MSPLTYVPCFLLEADFAVSPVSVFLCNVAVLLLFMSLTSLSFSTFPHLSVNLVVFLFLFIVQFLGPHLALLCLFSFRPLAQPSFFLSPILPALCPLPFKSNFLLYSMKGTAVFLYLQQTECIAASPVHWSL